MILWSAKVSADSPDTPASPGTYTTSLATIKDFVREYPNTKWSVFKLDIGGVTNQKVCDLLNGSGSTYVAETLKFEVSDKGRLKTL